MNRKAVLPRIVSLAAVLLALTAWWIVTANGWVKPLFLPSPPDVWRAFTDMVTSGYKGSPLALHIWDSMYRLGAAFALALLTAVPLGILSGSNKWVQAALYPFIEFYRPLPPLAYYTVLVLWLGIEDASKIMLLFLAAFAPLYIAVVSGVKRVPSDRINGARSLGASKWKIYVHIILPSCLPEIFIGIRTAVGVAYTTLAAAEMVAAVTGIGWMVLDASKFLRSDIVFAGIIMMGLIAILIDIAIRSLERKIVPWSGKE
ncbi:ABC transporter permease [Paenibacillus sp. GCM10012307]|nr:ABC transporter permease subunit [Paenibacillus roseus]